MGVPIIQVDAFTDAPFGGNPAAVCLLGAAAEQGWMQAVAREMNLSETAFVLRRDDGYGLRWFTPRAEVDLCGHATLATAHVLWTAGGVDPDERLSFHTRSGVLVASRRGDRIELDFPASPVVRVDPPAGLAAALGVEPILTAGEAADLVVLIDGEERLRALEPDFRALGRLEPMGVAVTAPSASPRYDFVSRVFCPGFGIDEDPVTGSAHCALGPFWGERLGKDELCAYQASARGGVVHVRLAGERVFIAGQAVTVMHGVIDV